LISKGKALNTAARIGFMQGRLSPMVDGRIQSFPWEHWRDELLLGHGIGFSILEWTLDQERLYESPLLHHVGQGEIRNLCAAHGFSIPSLTGDCFMQAPFWKAKGKQVEALKRDFIAVAKACAAVGIGMMVMPLVDNGRLENAAQEDALVMFLDDQKSFLQENKLKVVFESDYGPAELARFIARLDVDLFGVNYDIGNSAALGLDPVKEFEAYGDRVLNVHIKDRLLGGTTVPLGTGNADFKAVFAALARVGYDGNYILQTARASDDNHAGVLADYRDMAVAEIERQGA